MLNVSKILMAVALVIFLIVIGPWLVIWALNTLFPVLAIQFNLATWAAVLILGSFFQSGMVRRNK